MSYQKLANDDVPAPYPAIDKSLTMASAQFTINVPATGMVIEAAPARPRWRDVVFVAAFWLNLFAWIGVVIYAQTLPQRAAFDVVSRETIFAFAPVVLGVAGAAALLAAVANAAAFRAPRVYGFVAICFEMLFVAAYVTYVVLRVGPDPYVIAVGAIMELVLLFTAWNFYRFMDFAEQLVLCTRLVATQQKGNFVALVVGLLALLGWTAAWSFGAMSVLTQFGAGQLYAVIVHQVFTFYWCCETIRNVTHVTIAGSHASWYFQGEQYRVANPTLGAFRRAATYSLGSICFGSLLVAILMTLRRIFQVLRFQNSRNIALVIAGLLARLLLWIVEALLRFFNRYIFILIAITGDSYVASAKKTLQLFGEHGFEMVMQNNIVVSMMGATSVVAALAGGGIGYGLGVALHVDAYAALAIGAVLSTFIVEGSFVLLESGSMAILMCFLMQPDKLQFANPVLHKLLVKARDAPLAAKK